MQTLKKLVKYTSNNRNLVVFVCFFSIISVLLTLTAPVFIGNIIDDIGNLEYTKVIVKIKQLFLLYIFIFVTDSFLSYLINKLQTNIEISIREELFNKITTLKIKYIDMTSYGEIINKFSVDISNVSNIIYNVFIKIITCIVTIIFATIIMFKINWIMSLLVIISAPIIYLISKFITTRTNALFKKRADEISNLNGITEELIYAQKTIKDFLYENKAIERFKFESKELYNIGIKANFFSSLTNPVTRFISHISYIAVGILGVILTAKKYLSIGSISTFLLYTNIFSKPFNEITSIISELQQGISSAEKIFSFFYQFDETNFNYLESNIIGEVKFRNVNFSYNENSKFIENFNLDVKKGEKIAIVGKTGAGKTTIANLLLRFYDINSGSILIDGKSIYDYNLDFLRKNIGIVLQDTKLFTGTIKQNIAYGKDDATDKEIEEVAKIVQADSFIKRLRNGYETIIDNELMLSTGEIQLINLARMLLTRPPIIILDEATSNLDLVTESKIQSALLKVMNNSTSFIIAHRLSTIKNADKIIFIENGNIVEEGTHNELISKNGKYCELYEN